MKKTTKKVLWITAFAVFAVAAILAITQIISYYLTSGEAEEQHKGLEELISYGPAQTASGASGEGTTSGGGSGGGGDDYVPNYDELYKRNPDMIGWVKIDGTKINYPVMQTPAQYDYYLDHDFYKDHSAYGLPFVGDGMDALLPSDNIILYGHHMIDGTMFSAVDLYKSKDYYNAHKIIEFNTKNGYAKYEIFATVVTVVYTAADPFPYWEYIELDTEQRFNEFVGLVNKYKRYDTGITPKFGDKFLMLSTCEYSQTNGRTVIIARRADYRPIVPEKETSIESDPESGGETASKPTEPEEPEEPQETTTSE